MKALNRFFLLLLTLPFVGNVIGEINSSGTENGRFVTLQQVDGSRLRAFIAGPENAKAAVLVVHDYLGISDATKQSVEHLGALGYRAIAVDLYDGKSATSHEEAVKLMQALDRKATDKILQTGLDYLKRPGRKVATIGFSMGGQESLNANLNDPDSISATVIIYGFGFDKIDPKRLERLRSPVLSIAGSEDTGAVQATINFFSSMKEARRPYEMLIYPGADHGYAQPLFNGGKNYNVEAVRATWVVVEDFLGSHLRSDEQREDGDGTESTPLCSTTWPSKRY
jgi:carboxymethylenebutenolidase